MVQGRAGVVGGKFFRRALPRRYRQVSRCETGLIQLLGEDKGDGGYLVGVDQVAVADRRGARESGRPGVDDEGGAGGVVGGAGRGVADGALGSVQIRSRRKGALIDPGGGGAEGRDVSEVVAGGYGAASDGHVIDCPDASPIGDAHHVGWLDSKGDYGGLAGFDGCFVNRDGGHGLSFQWDVDCAGALNSDRRAAVTSLSF